MQQRSPSPTFYRIIAVLFFLIGVALIWASIATHDRIYLVFGIITMLNALMSTLKSFVVRETGN